MTMCYVTGLVSDAWPSCAPDYSDQRTCWSRAHLISSLHSLILLPWKLRYDKEGQDHAPQFWLDMQSGHREAIRPPQELGGTPGIPQHTGVLKTRKVGWHISQIYFFTDIFNSSFQLLSETYC